jgi:hypothetical protein
MSDAEGRITLFEVHTEGPHPFTEGETTDVGLRIRSCSTENCDGIHIYLEVQVDGLTNGWARIAWLAPTSPAAALAGSGLLSDILLLLMGKERRERRAVAEEVSAAYDIMQDRILQHVAADGLMREAAQAAERGDVH